MVPKTWHSTPSGNFCCKRFDGLQNCTKEGKIAKKGKTAKLLGLSQNIKNPCLRRSQHNIVVRKNDCGRSIRRVCKLCYTDKRTDR